MPTILTRTCGASGFDYPTLSAMEADLDNNLVSLDQQIDEKLANEGFTAATHAGATTDATRFRRLTFISGAFHSYARLGALVTGVLSANEAFLEFVGFRVTNPTGSGVPINSADVLIDRMLIHEIGNSNLHNGIEVIAARVRIYRTIVANVPSGGDGIKITSGSATDSKAYRNLVANSKQGITYGATSKLTADCKGNLIGSSVASHTCFSATNIPATASHNLTDDATAPGTSAQINKPLGSQITTATAGSENFTPLTGGGSYRDTGVLLASAFTVDGLGTTIPQVEAADIGPIEAIVIPTVSLCAPASGPTTGLTDITITGTNFTTAINGVTVKGVAATNVVRVSSTRIDCRTGIGTAGIGDVIVTNSDGQVSTGGANLFTYVAGSSSQMELASPITETVELSSPITESVELASPITESVELTSTIDE